MPPTNPVLTATLFDTSNPAYVRLTLTADGSTRGTIKRQGPNGQSVVVRDGKDLDISNSTVAYISDYEIPQSETLNYWAEVTDGSTSITTSYVTITGLNRGVDWMFPIGDPGGGMEVNVVSLEDISYDTTSDTAKVLNRSDPVVVSWGRTLGRGSITLVTLSDEERREFTAMVSSGRVVMFQPRIGYGFDDALFMSFGEIRESRPSRRGNQPARQWECDFQLVAAPPPQFTIVLGERWVDVSNSYASWNALATAGKTWRQVIGV